MMSRNIITSILLVLFVVSFVSADTMILQDGLAGYSGTADTWLNSVAVYTNYGAGEDLYIRSGQLENTLIKFDIPDLSNAVISSATLKLYNYDDGGPGWECTMDAYRMQQTWAEGTAGTAGGSFYDYVGSSWWYYDGSWSASWGSRAGGADGALGVGDHGVAPTASVNWTNYGSVWSITNPGWRELDVTSDVQAFASGAAANFGWHLLLADGSRPVFYSSDAVDASLRPVLEITYAAVPEPATLTLIGIGMLGLVKRKKN